MEERRTSEDDPSSPRRSETETFPPARQGYWALFVFTLSLIVNFLDRGIMNLLVEPIKNDLHLSDVQISVLMGFAFSVFYVLMGLPISWLVDTKSRRVLIAVGLVCWSGMTALCGLAQGFWSFFAFRTAMGVGEACSGPATLSMLADFFRRERLTRANAVLTVGAFGGMALAPLLGAATIKAAGALAPIEAPLVGTLRTWQWAFLIVGVPGLVVAALMATVVEPERKQRRGPKPAPFGEVFGFLLEHWKVYGPMFLGLALKTVYGFGAQSWKPTFFQRTYGVSPAESGTLVSLSFLIGAPAGLLLGNWLTERRYRAGFDDANMWVVFWASLAAIPAPILTPLMPTATTAVIVNTISLFIVSATTAPENAAFQIVTPNEMRGRVAALQLFIVNVIGFGLGPLSVATLTDVVFQDPKGLRYSLAIAAAIAGPLSTIVFWYGLKPYGAMAKRAP